MTAGAHPELGPNLKFPQRADLTVRGIDPNTVPGDNLYFRPLLRLDAKRLVLLDSAVAGPAFIGEVHAALQPHG